MSETEKMLEADEIPNKQLGIQSLQAFHCSCGVILKSTFKPSVYSLLKRQSSDVKDEDVCDYRELPMSSLCRSATVFISEKELCLAAGLACQQWSGCSAA